MDEPLYNHFYIIMNDIERESIEYCLNSSTDFFITDNFNSSFKSIYCFYYDKMTIEVIKLLLIYEIYCII